MTGRRYIETNALPTRPTIEALKCESMMSSCHLFVVNIFHLTFKLKVGHCCINNVPYVSGD